MCHTHCKASSSHCNVHNKIAELHIRPQDVILPMPPPTEEQIRAREERNRAASLSPSLVPPTAPLLNVTPLSHSLPVSTQAEPLVSTHAAPPVSTQAEPPVGTQAETSGDRAEQRAASMNHTCAGASNASGGPSNRAGPTINPRCTTQMSPAWLVQSRERDTALETRSNDAAEQKKRALIVQRQFILEFFDHVCSLILAPLPISKTDDIGQKKSVEIIAIQNISDADYPAYNAGMHFPLLTGVPHSELEILHVVSRTWMTVGADHIIMLSHGLHIFVRRRGAKCIGFDDRYRMFVNPPTFANIRSNLPRDRKFIRIKDKERKVIADSDSEIEASSPHPATPKPSRRRLGKTRSVKRPLPDSDVLSISDDTSPYSHSSVHAKKKTRIMTSAECLGRRVEQAALSDLDSHWLGSSPSKTVKIEKTQDLDNIILNDCGTGQGDVPAGPISIPSSPIAPVYSSPMQSPSIPSSPIPPLSPSPSYHSLQSNTANPAWPGGVYTADLVYAFRLMDDLKKSSHTSHLSLEDRFDAAFPGVPFKPTTYSNARTRYRLVDQEKLENSRNAGRTPHGLWSTISKTVNLRR